MTIGSLFSGIGGLELGLEWAGLGPTLWQVEQNEFCCKVLEKHWPDATRHHDVRAVGAKNLQPVDVICGGFPCQDISLAGAGAGLSGARSGLWFEYARIIGELRPRIVVVENVAALLGRGLGDVLGCLASLGYDAWWDCIPAASVGAPHRRDRLFVVGWMADTGRRDVQRERSARVVSAPSGRTQGEGDERQRLRDAACDGGEDMADPNGPRQRGIGRSGLLDSERTTCGNDADRCGGEGIVGHASQRGLRCGEAPWTSGQPAQPDQAMCDSHDARLDDSGAWQAQPGLGREPDGLPHRLDRWPARPGEAQHQWEAPRVCGKCDNRAARLKALGNAVVPQVGYVVGQVVRRIMETA